MIKRYTIVVLVFIIVITLLILYVFNQLSNLDNTKENNIPSITTAFVDRCTFVTPSIIKTTLGFDVLKKSSTGTSCTYEDSNGEDKTIITVSVYYGDANLYYLPESYNNRIDASNLGDRGFYTKPINGLAVAQLVKNQKILTISITSGKSFDGNQVKSLLTASALNL